MAMEPILMLLLVVLSLILYCSDIVQSWLISLVRNLRRIFSKSVSWASGHISWRCAQSVLGWRKEDSLAPVNQIGSEYVTEAVGQFGVEQFTRYGSLSAEPGQFGVRVKMAGPSTRRHYKLPVIPLAVTYSSKVSELMSVAPATTSKPQHLARSTTGRFAHASTWPPSSLCTSRRLRITAMKSHCLPIAQFCCLRMARSVMRPASSAFESQQGFITD